jgi:hypothetical protein
MDDLTELCARLRNPKVEIWTQGIHGAMNVLTDFTVLKEAAAAIESLQQRIANYQGSRDHAIETLAAALKIEPDRVRAVEYYARLAGEAIESQQREIARLKREGDPLLGPSSAQVRANAAEAQAAALRKLIDDHNAGIESSCGRANEYTARARACDDYLKRGRQCVDCPYEWKIDAALAQKAAE